MISIFYLAIVAIPFIYTTNGYTDLRKRLNARNRDDSTSISKSLLPEFGDIAFIFLLSAFVIAYSCGSSG